MSSQNVSWDIQDQNDRIISILAWVVVVVLVLYAGVYFYKQARGAGDRPGLLTDARLSQPGTTTPPPTFPAVAVPQGPPSPSPELAVTGGDTTRVVSHRPVVHATPAETAPITAPPPPFGQAAAETAAAPEATPDLPPSAAGYAVRIGAPYASPKQAQDALFQLPVSVQDVDFVQDGDTWLLQVGKYKTVDEAKALLKKVQPHIQPAEIIALSDQPAPKKPSSRATKTPKAGADASTTASAATDKPARAPKTPKSSTKAAATRAAKAAAEAPPRGVAGKLGRTKKPVETEVPDAEDADEAAAAAPEESTKPRTRAKRPAPEDSTESGVVAAVAAGDTSDEASTPSDTESTEPRRKPAAARRRTAASTAGDVQPFTAETDASGEVDASPTSAANRRPNARSRRTSAGTATDASAEATASEEEPVQAPARPRTATSVQQQIATAARAEEAGSHRYSLQVGAYSSEEKARTVASQLRSNGLAARVDEAVTGDTTVFRVRLGSFGDTTEAQTARRRVAGELGFPDVRVIKD